MKSIFDYFNDDSVKDSLTTAPKHNNLFNEPYDPFPSYPYPENLWTFWWPYSYTTTTLSETFPTFHEFVDKGVTYELVLPISKKVVGSDITIDVIDEKAIKIKYEHKEDNSFTSGSYEYTLPKDVQPDTLTAIIDNSKGETNQLKITVTKKTLTDTTSSSRRIEIK